MAKQFDSIDEPPKKKASLCSCVCNFLIWLFPVCLALGVALYFSPNERVVDIITYNERAKEWMQTGLDDFKNATFSVCINGDCSPAAFSQEFTGALYPTGDKCDKEGDPKEGCVSTVPGYFIRKLENVPKTIDLAIYTEDSKIVVNATISIPSSKTFLKSICYRVRPAINDYELDIPPKWPLRTNPSDPGCEFGNAWEPVEFSKKPVDSVPIIIRSYQDPYIAASSLTRGCNEDEKNAGCFGITSSEMKMYGLYAILAMGAVTVIELIVLLSACCCCRQKIPCCNKEYDDMN